MMIQFGLMNRGQFPVGGDAAQHWQEMLEQVRLAEKLGFVSIMKGSHYSTHPLTDFQQVPFLSRIMDEAPSLRLIAGVVLLPLHKPLDIAEQFANIDVMSGGRLIFGVGVGYRDIEFRAFGTTSKEAGRRLEEGLDAIRRLWTEEKVSMTASHFELIEACCTIQPMQKPLPPIWTGANADVAIRRAARLTDAWFVNPHNRIETIAQQMEVYKRELDACGKPFPAEFPMMREVVVSSSRAEAMRKAQPYLEAKYNAYHEWGQDKVMPVGDNNFAVDFDELVRDRFLFGSPEEIADQILDLVKRFGVNHFVMGVQFPGMPQNMVLEQMQMLAEKVFPLVRTGI